MTEAKAREKLRDYTQRFDTNREAAESLEITPQQLSDVLRNKRGVSEGIAAKIGLTLKIKTVRTYQEVA